MMYGTVNEGQNVNASNSDLESLTINSISEPLLDKENKNIYRLIYNTKLPKQKFVEPLHTC